MTKTQKIIKIVAICLAITIIVNIISILFSIFVNLTNITFFENQSEKVTFTKEYNDIEKIEIDGINASITIKQGPDFTVKAINLDKNFTTNSINKTLKIEENSSWLSRMNGSGTIIITIPTSTILEELSIDTGAGKFIIENIATKELDINHGAGILEISNSKFNTSDIDGGAGKIKITNTTLNNLELDSGVGKVDIEANITGNSQIESGVGEMNITLLGNEQDYNIKMKKGLGTIKLNNIPQENNTIYGTGPNKLKIEGGVGNININFK